MGPVPAILSQPRDALGMPAVPSGAVVLARSDAKREPSAPCPAVARARTRNRGAPMSRDVVELNGIEPSAS